MTSAKIACKDVRGACKAVAMRLLNVQQAVAGKRVLSAGQVQDASDVLSPPFAHAIMC